MTQYQTVNVVIREDDYYVEDGFVEVITFHTRQSFESINQARLYQDHLDTQFDLDVISKENTMRTRPTTTHSGNIWSY